MHQRARTALLAIVTAVALLAAVMPGVASAGPTPSAPGFRTVTPCPVSCTGNVTVFTPTPTLSAWARDDAGDVLTYQYEVYSGRSTAPTAGALVASGTSTPTSNVALDRWTVTGGAITAEGSFEYRVRAAPRGTAAYGPWSVGWIHFFVYLPPKPPTLTLSGVGTNAGSPTGTVGHVATLHITDNDPTVTYVSYSLFEQVVAVPVTIGFPLHCGYRTYGDVVYVCRNADGSWPDQQIAPIATSGTVWASSVNAKHETSTLVTQPYYANADQAGLRSGHSWTFEPTAGTPGYLNPTVAASGPVPDTATTGATPLGHGTGVTLGLDAPNPVATGRDPGSGNSVPAKVTVSSFAGTGSESTAQAVLDPKSAFTVGAWVKSPAAGRGQYYTLLSQNGSQESSFFLQNSNGNWTFCMPETDVATYHGPCAYQYNTPVQPGTWTFVAGAWNPVNQSLTVYVGDGTTLSTIMRTSTVAGPASNGPLFVGQDTIGANPRYFKGGIDDPFAVQASLTTAQVTALMGYGPPAQG